MCCCCFECLFTPSCCWWVIGINDNLMMETLLYRVHLGISKKMNIYSGAVVGCRVLDIGVWFVEIHLVFCHTYNIRKHCVYRVANSKKEKLAFLRYTQVLSAPVDINRICLSVRHCAIYSCHQLLSLPFIAVTNCSLSHL
jgi:hypothetical protein